MTVWRPTSRDGFWTPPKGVAGAISSVGTARETRREAPGPARDLPGEMSFVPKVRATSEPLTTRDPTRSAAARPPSPFSRVSQRLKRGMAPTPAGTRRGYKGALPLHQVQRRIYAETATLDRRFRHLLYSDP